MGGWPEPRRFVTRVNRPILFTPSQVPRDCRSRPASYRLKQSVGQRWAAVQAEQNQATAEIVDSNTGEITTI